MCVQLYFFFQIRIQTKKNIFIPHIFALWAVAYQFQLEPFNCYGLMESAGNGSTFQNIDVVFNFFVDIFMEPKTTSTR
jgi:hypothetical protein